MLGPGVGPRSDPEPDEAAFPLPDDEVVAEQLEAFDEHVFAVRDHLLPALARGFGHRRPHEPEVPRAVVRPDVEVVAQVIDVVLVLALAREEDGRFVFGVVRIHVAVLGRERLGRRDDHVAPRFRAEHPGVEGFVGLFIDEHVRRSVRSQPVSPDLVPAERDCVLLRIEDRSVVVRPGEVSGHRRDLIGEKLARREVLETNVVEASSHGVGRIGEDPMVRTDRLGEHGQEVVALGERVRVDEDLFGSLQGATLTRVDRVLLSVFEALEVVPVVAPIGNGGVVLLDAALDLLEEGLPEPREMRGHRVRVDVLGFQVGDHLRVLALS